MLEISTPPVKSPECFKLHVCLVCGKKFNIAVSSEEKSKHLHCPWCQNKTILVKNLIDADIIQRYTQIRGIYDQLIEELERDE